MSQHWEVAVDLGAGLDLGRWQGWGTMGLSPIYEDFSREDACHVQPVGVGGLSVSGGSDINVHALWQIPEDLHKMMLFTRSLAAHKHIPSKCE